VMWEQNSGVYIGTVVCGENSGICVGTVMWGQNSGVYVSTVMWGQNSGVCVGTASPLSHMRYMHSPSHSSRFYHPHSIG
jgi:hypothetical protein